MTISKSSKDISFFLISGLLILFCLSSCSQVVPITDKSSTSDQSIISIITTTDLHGHIETLPRIAGFISNLRKARSADGGGVLLLDGGDMFQGELASNLDEGATVVEAYNQMGYGAVTIGNHEFDFGPVGPSVIPKPGDNPRGALQARAAQANYPFLAANTIDRKTGKPLVAPNIKPSTIIEINGVKVGLIGVLTLEATQSIIVPIFSGLRLGPLDDAINHQAQLLRSKAKQVRARGATIVIAIAHAGGSCTKFDNPDDLSSCNQNAEIFEVARKLEPGLVDAIVAGHTHQKLAHRVNGIPIIQAGKNGETLARLDLYVEAKSGYVSKNVLHAPVDVCKKVAGNSSCENVHYEGLAVSDDPEVTRIVNVAIEASNQRRNELIGVELSTPVRRATVAGAESALGNLVADLMRKARPNVDVAITHAGGLRADLPTGPLQYGSLYEVYPRDSTFAVATLTGSQLESAIAKNLSGPTGLLISISGASVEAQCSPNGQLDVVLRNEGGHQIGPQEPVVVATNTLLALGSEGPFTGIQWSVEDDPPIREELVKVLASQGGILRGDGIPLFNPQHPRVTISSVPPVKCLKE